MKTVLPAKLFRPLPQQVSISARHVNRLLPHLASTGKLNELLVLDAIPTTDLQRMLLLETDRPTPRYPVVRKLIARILSRERERMIKEVYHGRTIPTT